MVHLIIKELASSAEDTIMVTSTIMKDTGGSTEAIYRPNAIRALCRIIDVCRIPFVIVGHREWLGLTQGCYRLRLCNQLNV